MLLVTGYRSSMLRLLVGAGTIACAALAALSSPPEASALEPCGKAGYSYAGFRSANAGHGVRATLVPLAQPSVSDGHVAAWVGVGGAGEGPHGSDQWLQVGLAAFNGSGSRLYYEVTTGGAPPRYNEVVSEIAPGQASRVAVLEMSKRPNWWRVWLNGKAVSRPIHLPGSSGRFHPIATAETWDGGVPRLQPLLVPVRKPPRRLEPRRLLEAVRPRTALPRSRLPRNDRRGHLVRRRRRLNDF